jgi:hypothetical protein
MTPDTTGETVDGMSREKIDTLIGLIRQERWRWTPVKRISIPKRKGKLRPLGLPSWSSKVMQEVVRQLLDDPRGQRQVNEMVALRVPKEVMEQKCALYMRRGKPAQRGVLIRDSDYSMVSK